METKPTAFHSLHEWVTESLVSTGATIYNTAAQSEEEDIVMQAYKSNITNRIQCVSTESEYNSTWCEEEFPAPP
ncbi:unnamed protein product [Knipowitschia caucasica]